MLHISLNACIHNSSFIRFFFRLLQILKEEEDPLLLLEEGEGVHQRSSSSSRKAESCFQWKLFDEEIFIIILFFFFIRTTKIQLIVLLSIAAGVEIEMTRKWEWKLFLFFTCNNKKSFLNAKCNELRILCHKNYLNIIILSDFRKLLWQI